MEKTEWATDPTGSVVTLITVDSGGVTGTVRAVFTRGDHAHVTAGTSGMGEPPELLYRGKRFSVALHLFASCGWASEPDNPVTRPHVHDMKGADAAPTFKAAIPAAVAEAVAAMVAKYPEIPLHAEVNRRTKEASDAAREMASTRKHYDEAVIAHAKAQTLLQEARNHLGESG